MRIKKFDKKLFDALRYPFKQVDQYPAEKQREYLEHLCSKIIKGRGTIDDFIEWFKVVEKMR